MIHELRIYTAHPGKMGALLARFRDHTTGLFERHGITNVGYWLNSIGGRSEHHMIESPQGHDGFLLETERIGPLLTDFLDRVEKDDA